ncbi:NAD(P)H-binding protein [Parvibaculum sp.]|uniref:NAD(P)H-binding protein n=1 Tax=Parvibaculum sp. TaxID=2024848 RepID=UPI0034A05656
MIEKTALIAGATGLVGGHLLKLLLADPQYGHVVAVTRRKLEGVSSPKLEELVVDFDALDKSLAQKDIPVDDAYCALGTTIKTAGSQEAFRKVDFDAIVAFAKAAKARGAKRLMLVSSIGADPASSVFYSRVKGETEQALGAIGFETLHIFRPGLLIGERAETRPVESIGKLVSPVLDAMMLGPMRVYRSMRVENVARAMLAAASTATSGRQIHTYDQMMYLAGA